MSALFKMIKAVASILMFSLNNTMNDFFCAYFFMATSFLGWLYFTICGYVYPRNTGKRRYLSKEPRTLDQHHQSVLEIEYNKRLYIGNMLIIFFTIIFTVIGFIAFNFSSDLFVGKEVTTLGASAVLMILVNG